MCRLEAQNLWTGLIQRGWPLIATSIVAGVGSLFALRSNKYQLGNLLAATAVATVLIGWALGLYPVLVPPAITIQNSKAPDVVLWAMATCILIGGAIMFPALWWLFRIFKSEDIVQS